MFRRVTFELKQGEVAGLSFGDSTRPPDIVFLHANGMNARTYSSMLAPMAERFHVLALDLRGHGQSTLPPRLFGFSSWRRHRDDVIAVLKNHIAAPVTMAGHSMGATVSLMVAGARPDLVRGVAMIEPALFMPGFYAMMQAPGAVAISGQMLPLARNARRRRERFDSLQAAEGALAGRGVFATWERQFLVDYVADGFLDDGEGGVRLACPPQWEAANFIAQRHDPWEALTRAPAPIVVLRAERNPAFSAAAADLMQRMRADARIAMIEGSTHSLPMERPDRARAAIETAAFIARPEGPYRDLV